MKKRFLLLLPLLICCTLALASEGLGDIYERLMHGFSSQARQAAQDFPAQEAGLSLNEREEQIYQLGLARGYDLGLRHRETQGAGAATVWISTIDGLKYHQNALCSGMKEPHEIALDDALYLGYTPCQNCFPTTDE